MVPVGSFQISCPAPGPGLIVFKSDVSLRGMPGIQATSGVAFFLIVAFNVNVFLIADRYLRIRCHTLQVSNIKHLSRMNLRCMFTWIIMLNMGLDFYTGIVLNFCQ